MNEIKSISCVTSVGAGHEYAVGCEGVIKISYIKGYEDGSGSYFPGWYEVHSASGLVARISEICPIVLGY